eukprot:TRINITY_DN18516_c0_g1_i1.p1 TRINITY_DN18516_c0_g1~~TRINITY_DN18516_c0_g1_i1.p1  ORF type:complete len:631 (+),score=75.47 TRINITY_DN18516_c0_g1_i1:74-1894(+)
MVDGAPNKETMLSSQRPKRRGRCCSLPRPRSAAVEGAGLGARRVLCSGPWRRISVARPAALRYAAALATAWASCVTASSASSTSGSASSASGGASGAGHESGGSGGHHGHEDWWDHPYEYRHIQAYIVVALVLMTIVFEVAHHKVDHFVDDTYQFGRASVSQTAHEHHVHSVVPVFKRLFNRASGEFMVLGFLAFVVWLCNQAGAFAAIAKAIENDPSIKMPGTVTDLLHTVENVHMQLFMAMLMFYMIVYFALRCSIALEKRWDKSNRRILTRYQSGLGINAEWLAALPRDTQYFYHFREWFFQSLEEWTGRWEMAENILSSLKPRIQHFQEQQCCSGLSTDNADDQKELDLPEMMRQWFPFASYLALNFRYVVDDFMAFNLSSWGFIVVVYLVQAQIHKGARADLEYSSPFWITIVFVFMLAATGWVTFQARLVFQNKINSSARENCCLSIHRLHPSHWFVAAVQVCVFFVCFEFATVVGDIHRWQVDPTMPAVYLICLFLGFVPVGMWIGWVLPAFVAVVSTGWFMQEHHLFRLAVIINVHAESEGGQLDKSKSFFDDYATVDSQIHRVITSLSTRQPKAERSDTLETPSPSSAHPNAPEELS